jgi:predicted DNA-binding WGR domain protein
MTTTSFTLYLELADERHYKFYEVIITDTSVIAKYGRIGYTGTVKLYQFETSGAALNFYHRQVRRKIKKGYEVAVKGERLPRPAFTHPGQLKIFFII